MKKSILFTGPQGSGKTTKIRTLLSCLDQKRVIEMTFDEFKLAKKSELEKKYDFIAIDEVVNAIEFKYLLKAAIVNNFSLILGTQITIVELERNTWRNLSVFHVVELVDSKMA